MNRDLGAASSQTAGGTPYQFQTWSDGGTAAHTVTTPAVNSTYTATYVAGGPPTSVSLLSDGGFENGGTGWQQVTNGGRSVTTAHAHSGMKSVQMMASNLYPRQVLQDVPANPGSTHDASVWISTAGLASSARASIVWFNASSKAVRTDVLGMLPGTVPWTRVSAALTPPSNAARARFLLELPVEPDGAGSAWFATTWDELRRCQWIEHLDAVGKYRLTSGVRISVIHYDGWG